MSLLDELTRIHNERQLDERSLSQLRNCLQYYTV